MEEFEVGDEVIVDYEGKEFEGQIHSLSQKHRTVQGMRVFNVYYEKDDSIENDVLESRFVCRGNFYYRVPFKGAYFPVTEE